MFGSNYSEVFGIPAQAPFPFQGSDAQGGMLASNVPVPAQGGPPLNLTATQPGNPGQMPSPPPAAQPAARR